MGFITFVFFAVLASSLVSAGPVVLDNAILFENGQQAQILNAEFKNLHVNDSCITGEAACINNFLAVCIDNAWETQRCFSTQSCFALPQLRTNGTFVACTSQKNAASIIAATGAHGGITSNTTSWCNTTVPFPSIDSSLDNIDDCGDDADGSPSRDSNRNTTQWTNDGGDPDCRDDGRSSSPGPVTITIIVLPPTTTTMLPEQASSLISSISANGMISPHFSASGARPSGGSNENTNDVPPPVILLTSQHLSTPAQTSFPSPSPSAM